MQSRRLNENQTRSNYKSQMNPYPWLLKYSVHTSPYHYLPYHDSVGAYLTILVLVLVLKRGRKDSSALLSRKFLQRIQKGFAKRQILLPETGWINQYQYQSVSTIVNQYQTFSHHQQGRIGFNTVNPSLSTGKDFLIHSL